MVPVIAGLFIGGRKETDLMSKKRDKRHKKVAGIDIGAEEIYVAVPKGRGEENVGSFLTFTADLHQLSDWLEVCGIEIVAMESTVVYWIPLCEILESRCFEVYLVNARNIKNVSGSNSYIPMDCCNHHFGHQSNLRHSRFSATP